VLSGVRRFVAPQHLNCRLQRFSSNRSVFERAEGQRRAKAILLVQTRPMRAMQPTPKGVEGGQPPLRALPGDGSGTPGPNVISLARLCARLEAQSGYASSLSCSGGHKAAIMKDEWSMTPILSSRFIGGRLQMAPVFGPSFRSRPGT